MSCKALSPNPPVSSKSGPRRACKSSGLKLNCTPVVHEKPASMNINPVAALDGPLLLQRNTQRTIVNFNIVYPLRKALPYTGAATKLLDKINVF